MMEKLVRVNAQKRERQYDDDCFTQVGFAGCRELRDRQPHEDRGGRHQRAVAADQRERGRECAHQFH